MTDMQAGRELDAQIAKLFGHDVRVWHDKLALIWTNNGYDTIPHYSTTWSGMQLVVEEMQRREWDFTLNWHKKQVTKTVYKAVFGTFYFGVSSSAPHAVALAAIEALKESV